MPIEPGIFKRSSHNPLITGGDIPYQVNTVFNAGVADLTDQVLLALRVESCSGRSHLTLARSRNGETEWKIDNTPFMHAEDGGEHEAYGIEDCRITQFEDSSADWFLTYTAYSRYGPAIAIARTTDFKNVERISIAFPPTNKNAVIFPRKIKGLYAMLHRPANNGGCIWIGYSPDLRYWGDSEVLIPTRGGPWWDGCRVGAGVPPIETSAGWLLIYHGVKQMASGPIYRVGAVLLDIKNPNKVIARPRRWLLTPMEPYERTGDVPNVLFPCGGFVRNQELWMYYGAADASLCLAKASLTAIIDYVLTD